MKKVLIFIAAALLAAPVIKAQNVTVELTEDQLKPIKSKILNDNEQHRANTWDMANFRFYAKANEKLTKAPKTVLMGNSITQGWVEFDEEWLLAHDILGRGISGQVSGQMLMRFRQDVINLKPQNVVILCGVNDIARNQGFITVDHVMENIISMVELAKANKIKPYLCTVLPAAYIGWRPQVKDAPEQIAKLNQMIKEYCAANKVALIDYFPAMVDTDGKSLKAQYQRDAVHPNLEGYKAMEDLLCKALKIKN